jgi:hypothetical protein
MTERVTRQVLAVVVRIRDGRPQAIPQVASVWPDSQFLMVALDGKVTIVKPTKRKDYPGFPGFEVWQ